MKRVLLTVTLLLTSSALFGQTINQSSPYKLTPGKSFAASGGSTVRVTKQITTEFDEARALISRFYSGGTTTDTPTLVGSALTGALRTLDPHSTYFSADDWKELLDEENSGYTGIGATISEFTKNGETATYVLDTFPGSAAQRADLKFGDKIVTVNGVPTFGKDIDTIRESLRGSAGTTLRVSVERAASLTIESLDLKRSSIRQPSVPDFYLLAPQVGYVDMTEGFNYTTSDELDTAIRGLKRQGISSLILDLRGNPGGIVEQAVKVAQKFLPEGTLVVTQRGRNSTDNRDWYSTTKLPETMPLVLLVDNDTASASEIVAGAFQDNDRALIVGSRTFGKGLVQSVIDLPGGAGVTLTAARYLTPSGRSIQRDYSSIGLYDYYQHTSPAGAIDQPFFEARTTTGRKILGGNGIEPDREMNPERELNRRVLDTIFFYVRDTANGRTVALPVEKEIGRQLTFYETLAKSSIGPARRQLIVSDPQVKAAIAEIPLAAELAAKSTKVVHRVATHRSGEVSTFALLSQGLSRQPRSHISLP